MIVCVRVRQRRHIASSCWCVHVLARNSDVENARELQSGGAMDHHMDA